MTTLLVNDHRAISVRLFHPWQGAWVAEVDFDLGLVPTVPSGRVVLKIGDAILQGSVEDDRSGRFGEKARARIVAGGGGWHKEVPALHLHNDGGVFSSAVIAVTAASVGEAAVVVEPKRLGVDYSRFAGPASRVLAGLEWHVTTAGVTTVGPRLPLPMPPSLDVLSWDPHERRAEIAYDGILTPGTVLVDPRFGTVTVRDVEQTFDDGGSRGNAWCSPTAEPGTSRLASLFRAIAREGAGVASLRTYRYRVVLQHPISRRATLQAIMRGAGAPDSVEIPTWLGAKAQLTPGTECAVVFLDGDPGQPAVVAVKEGGVARLTFGSDAAPPVVLATALEQLKAAIAAAPIVPLDGGAAFKASLVAALSSWPAGVVSTHLFSD